MGCEDRAQGVKLRAGQPSQTEEGPCRGRGSHAHGGVVHSGRSHGRPLRKEGCSSCDRCESAGAVGTTSGEACALKVHRLRAVGTDSLGSKHGQGHSSCGLQRTCPWRSLARRHVTLICASLGMCVCAHTSLFNKDTSHIGVGPPHNRSLYVTCL